MTCSFDSDDRENAKFLLRFYLRKLVEWGHVRADRIREGLTMDWQQSARLEFMGMAAAATQDSAGRAVVLLRPGASTPEFAWTLSHEAVHIAQICRGDLEYPCGGGIKWKGRLNAPLDSSDPNYEQQPCEEEAFRLAADLRFALLAEYPKLKGIFLGEDTTATSDEQEEDEN